MVWSIVEPPPVDIPSLTEERAKRASAQVGIV
jgi:hypothetical protein